MFLQALTTVCVFSHLSAQPSKLLFCAFQKWCIAVWCPCVDWLTCLCPDSPLQIASANHHSHCCAFQSGSVFSADISCRMAPHVQNDFPFALCLLHTLRCVISSMTMKSVISVFPWCLRNSAGRVFTSVPFTGYGCSSSSPSSFFLRGASCSWWVFCSWSESRTRWPEIELLVRAVKLLMVRTRSSHPCPTTLATHSVVTSHMWATALVNAW